MDDEKLEEYLSQIADTATEVCALIETVADSCEKNDLTTQELPLRIAAKMQEGAISRLCDYKICNCNL